MIYAPLLFLLLGQRMIAVKQAGRPTRPSAAVVNDDQVLKNFLGDTSGPALLAFFRRRMTASVDAEQVAKLTKQLSDNSEEIHAKAVAELIGLGPLVVPALRRTANHADNEETLSRARKCLQAIEGATGSTVVQGAVRALAAHNPEGAVETLLKYLPLADDDMVMQEIETALLAIGMNDGKPEPALTKALTDAVPIRRGVAARVLCKVGGSAERTAVRPLLKDPKPSARMLAALTLTEQRDAEAMVVLIDLIAELPPEGRRRVEEFLSELAGEWAVKTPQGSDGVSGRLRRDLWNAWWHSFDDKQLLDEFRNRTLSEEERGRALKWIGKFGDASADVRAKAAESIIGMGAKTTSLLRQTMERQESKDPERQKRISELARQCLSAIEGGASRPLPEATTRLLSLRKPRGTVETLLAYIPFVESETLEEQLIEVLASAGCTGGKGESALVRALEDKLSARRAAAVMALCKGKADGDLPAIRKLLRDSDTIVRLRAGVGLAQLGDKSAVPVLIALLTDLPLDRIWEAEDVLTTLAGDNSPSQRVSSDKGSRAASVKAWNDWWKKEEKNVDLAKLHDPDRNNGLLLAIDMQGGKVLEVTRNGRVRWQLQGPQWPWDAVVCRNGNVFIVHQNTNQVSMWSRQGKQLWQKQCNMPFYCQLMRNGNIFVGCRQQISEFDVNGKEVSSRNLGHMNWIVGSYKFPNGHVGLFTQPGEYVRIDGDGKQVKSYQATLPGCVAMNAEVLPGDRVVASLNISRVAEYNDKGKSVWECNVMNPAVPHRLPNGHTLVTQNGGNRLYEIDRKGKIVSEKKDLEFRAWRIRRR